MKHGDEYLWITVKVGLNDIHAHFHGLGTTGLKVRLGHFGLVTRGVILDLSCLVGILTDWRFTVMVVSEFSKWKNRRLIQWLPLHTQRAEKRAGLGTKVHA